MPTNQVLSQARPRPTHRRVSSLLLVAGLSVLPAACSSGTPSATPAGSPGSGGTTTPTSSAATTAVADPVQVTAAFYPLEFAVARIGGNRVTITQLTKPGQEPHDLELTPQDVAQLGRAKVVVVLAGFQPAVDKAVEQRAAATRLDVAAVAGLDLEAPAGGDQDHGDQDHGDHAQDLHFWLDPQRYAAVGTAVAERLAQVDPAGANTYRANAATFAAELTTLHGEYQAGLATCANRTMVTGHAAFGYLAQRYQLTQVPIAGLSPEQEPSAKQLAAVAATVRQVKATTIYAEPLVDPKYAQTVATSTGATVVTLDPVEGVRSPDDFFTVMRRNLATLRTGQGCS